jgi:hypothetical protein
MITTSLELSIAQALAYADVFDSPMTPTEIHRYLIGGAAPLPAVRATLETASAPGGWIRPEGGYYTLRGRRALAETRASRSLRAASLWPEAIRYGRRISRLPFVRMVAVTGALAVDNPGENEDIDYLIVTAPGRLWISRGLILVLARWAARGGVTLCPNYLIARTERAMVFPEQNLYTAHEVAQMVPLAGMEVYDELRRRNRWVLDYLPNANGAPGTPGARVGRRPVDRAVRWLLELPLRTRAGDRLEAWEMERKIRKLAREKEPSSEASFSAEWCKGHFHNHERETMEAFAERLASLGAPRPAEDSKVRSWVEGARTVS